MATEQQLPAIPDRSQVSLVLAVLGGLAFGGGSATAWFLLTDQHLPAALAKPVSTSDTINFVKIQRLTVPLADPRGNMLGFVTLDLDLEVSRAKAEMVKQRIPLIRHRINALVHEQSFVRYDRANQFDFDRATPELLRAANAALPEPAIKSINIVVALPI
jgi:flagellar basal body-associated protein FliL